MTYDGRRELMEFFVSELKDLFYGNDNYVGFQRDNIYEAASLLVVHCIVNSLNKDEISYYFKETFQEFESEIYPVVTLVHLTMAKLLGRNNDD